MGVYGLDKSSPKKYGLPRAGLSDFRRKFMTRRYLCLWVLLALVPCYLLRQVIFYQSSTAAASYARIPSDERLTVASRNKIPLPLEKPTSAYEKPSELVGEKPTNADDEKLLTKKDEKPKSVDEKPTEEEKKAEEKSEEKKEKKVKKAKEKSVLDFLFKSSTIKPAQYNSGSSGLTTTENATLNSLKLKLKDNFEDDEDFGVAEDNDKAEEQMWTAPPAPSRAKSKTIPGR